MPPRVGTPQLVDVRSGTPQVDPYVDARHRSPAPGYDAYAQHQQYPSQQQQQQYQYGGGYGQQQQQQQQQYHGGGGYDQRGYGGGY